MRKPALLAVLLAGLGLSAGAYYSLRGSGPEPHVALQPLTRGDVVETVGASGTLEPVTTVQVGTQVSGTVKELYADFNSLVRRGQVIARLEPSLFQTQIDQARANLVRAEADVERLRVTVEDARTRLQRAEDLFARRLISTSDLETAQVTLRAADAQLRSSRAQVTQAQASLSQTEVNLEHTVIRAPIDGIVISRNVDVGQTVAASMQAPVLYLLAADLTKMRVNASIDESDVGRIRPGQAVRFRVDAYPAEEFSGTVQQVRLQPTVVQNVVTYTAVIDVPNGELQLKPGMTANVVVEIGRGNGALRIPNAALRFRPTPEIFAALRQEAPPDPPAGAPEWAAAGRGVPAANPERAARLQNLPPERREEIRVRMRQRPDADPGAPRRDGAAAPVTPDGAATIDSLFGPLPPTTSTGRVWLYLGGKLTPARVRLGISDGSFTELLDGDLPPDAELVTAVVTGRETAAAGAGGGQSPLIPTRGPRRR